MNMGTPEGKQASSPDSSESPGQTYSQDHLSYELNDVKNKQKIVLESYKYLQKNKQLTNSAKTKLLKELQSSDANMNDLFMCAIEIIGTATHDQAFVNQVKRDLDK